MNHSYVRKGNYKLLIFIWNLLTVTDKCVEFFDTGNDPFPVAVEIILFSKIII